LRIVAGEEKIGLHFRIEIDEGEKYDPETDGDCNGRAL